MKKKIVLFILVVIGVCAVINFNKNKQSPISGLAFRNIVALSQQEGTGGTYDYVTKLPFDCCTVYYGGSYLNGYKVICLTGSTFPVCSDCYIQ
jgi:hypothetical protein